MIHLLEGMMLSDVLLIMVALFVGFKWLVDALAWTKKFGQDVISHANEGANNKKRMDELEAKLAKNQQCILAQQDALMEVIESLSEQVSRLIESDKDDIKAYITEKHDLHHHELGWIDNYNLDCIEKRYTHYKAAGGNSFIGEFMADIRKLPKQPPK